MDLLSVVVIPARDEEERIGGCLAALARQTVARSSFEVIVVLDACRDQTSRVVELAAAELGLCVRAVPGPGLGAGAARRAGMEAAAGRLFAVGRPDGLIACTDADSVPAPDWLARQLEHVSVGAEVIAGMIELDFERDAAMPLGVLRRRERDAAERLSRVRMTDPDASHHHFAGASIGVTAAAYRRVGGLDPHPALEDAAFAGRLQRHGIAILRPSDVRVKTSARVRGRVARGLSVDLAVSSWAEQRRFRAGDFPPELLHARKGQTTVAVVIPTKECAPTIDAVLGDTVAPLAEVGLVDELIVIDAGSVDGTAEVAAAAGARVIQQDEILPEHGRALGKGDAMWRAVAATSSDVVCFLDGDTGNPHPAHLQGLLGPLLSDRSIQLVKGAFDRPLRAGDLELPNEGGRVTELMARPLLNVHEPRLAGFAQPLAGEFAARRELLESIAFPVGYGIEIAVLIDALRLHGLEALAECHVGARHNRHQPLRALGEMAYAVLAAVENRLQGRGSVVGGHYVRPWDDGAVVSIPVHERPPLRSLPVSRASAGLTRSSRLSS
jgi:glycosyltransferase involved in cell wall biosynthesis